MFIKGTVCEDLSHLLPDSALVPFTDAWIKLTEGQQQSTLCFIEQKMPEYSLTKSEGSWFYTLWDLEGKSKMLYYFNSVQMRCFSTGIFSSIFPILEAFLRVWCLGMYHTLGHFTQFVVELVRHYLTYIVSNQVTELHLECNLPE